MAAVAVPVAASPPVPAVAALPPPVAPEPPEAPRRRAELPPRRFIDERIAVNRFLVWMRAHMPERHFVGWKDSDTLMEFYRWFCHEERYDEMPIDLFLELVGRDAGVEKERKRLGTTTDPDLVALRENLIKRGRLTPEMRPRLYRVFSDEEMRDEGSAINITTRVERGRTPRAVLRHAA